MIKVGQKFLEARLRKGLALEDISQSTKIKISFLKAIEDGEYEKLPSSSYAQGFVRNYAKFLELPEKETLALFRREFDEEKVQKVLPQGFSKTNDFPLKRLKIRQTLFLAILPFLAILGYIIFQYRGAILNPSLSVSSPRQNAVISSSLVTVIGKTDPNSTVFISGTPVTVNGNGVFTKEINVFPGKVTIVIRVVNSFGKETILKREIEVKPGS